MKKSRKDKNALYWKIGVVSIILSVIFFIIAALLP
jgi:type IV secretory pathway component VirB8